MGQSISKMNKISEKLPVPGFVATNSDGLRFSSSRAVLDKDHKSNYRNFSMLQLLGFCPTPHPGHISATHGSTEGPPLGITSTGLGFYQEEASKALERASKVLKKNSAEVQSVTFKITDPDGKTVQTLDGKPVQSPPSATPSKDTTINTATTSATQTGDQEEPEKDPDNDSIEEKQQKKEEEQKSDKSGSSYSTHIATQLSKDTAIETEKKWRREKALLTNKLTINEQLEDRGFIQFPMIWAFVFTFINVFWLAMANYVKADGPNCDGELSEKFGEAGMPLETQKEEAANFWWFFFFFSPLWIAGANFSWVYLVFMYVFPDRSYHRFRDTPWPWSIGYFFMIFIVSGPFLYWYHIIEGKSNGGSVQMIVSKIITLCTYVPAFNMMILLPTIRLRMKERMIGLIQCVIQEHLLPVMLVTYWAVTWACCETLTLAFVPYRDMLERELDDSELSGQIIRVFAEFMYVFVFASVLLPGIRLAGGFLLRFFLADDMERLQQAVYLIQDTPEEFRKTKEAITALLPMEEWERFQYRFDVPKGDLEQLMKVCVARKLLIERLDVYCDGVNEGFRWMYGRIIFFKLSKSTFAFAVLKDFIHSFFQFGYRSTKASCVITILNQTRVRKWAKAEARKKRIRESMDLNALTIDGHSHAEGLSNVDGKSNIDADKKSGISNVKSGVSAKSANANEDVDTKSLNSKGIPQEDPTKDIDAAADVLLAEDFRPSHPRLVNFMEPLIKRFIEISSPLNVWWLSTWWRYNYVRDDYWLSGRNADKKALGPDGKPLILAASVNNRFIIESAPVVDFYKEKQKECVDFQQNNNRKMMMKEWNELEIKSRTQFVSRICAFLQFKLALRYSSRGSWKIISSTYLLISAFAIGATDSRFILRGDPMKPTISEIWENTAHFESYFLLPLILVIVDIIENICVRRVQMRSAVNFQYTLQHINNIFNNRMMLVIMAGLFWHVGCDPFFDQHKLIFCEENMFA